jgi:hypothetical protein
LDFSLLLFALDHPRYPYRLGDVVGVNTLHSEKCTHPRFALLHVRGVPEPDGRSSFFDDFKEMIQEQPYFADPSEPDVSRKRYWCAHLPLMTTTDADKLLSKREITLTWSDVKLFLAKTTIKGGGYKLISDGDL